MRLGIDVDDIRAANPGIVYGRGSAHGPKGRQADQGGFESTYWFRGGAASGATRAGGELVTMPGPGFGDSQTGLALAGGLAAALFHRERTGEALVVDASLLSSGIWAMQAALLGANLTARDELSPGERYEQANPDRDALWDRRPTVREAVDGGLGPLLGGLLRSHWTP